MKRFLALILTSLMVMTNSYSGSVSYAAEDSSEELIIDITDEAIEDTPEYENDLLNEDISEIILEEDEYEYDEDYAEDSENDEIEIIDENNSEPVEVPFEDANLDFYEHATTENISYEGAISYDGMGVIDEKGDLYTWGGNSYGTIGDGTKNSRKIDNKYNPLSNVKYIKGTSQKFIAITQDDDLYIWGGTSVKDDFPGYYVPTKMLSDVKTCVFSDANPSLATYAAITNTGDLYMWGHNDYGQVGNGSKGDYVEIPVKVLSNVYMASLSRHHSAAVLKDGSLYTWGDNSFGELGDGTQEESLVPKKIMSDIVYVSLNGDIDASSAAIDKNGNLYTWGSWLHLGREIKNVSESRNPKKILSNVKTVSMGCESAPGIAILRDGHLLTWGNNRHGALGRGLTEDQLKYSSEPTVVLENVKMAESDLYTVAALTYSGDLYIWGYNFAGSIGNGDKTVSNDVSIPLCIWDNIQYFDLDGGSGGMAVDSDSDVYTWGETGEGDYLFSSNTYNGRPMKRGIQALSHVSIEDEDPGEDDPDPGESSATISFDANGGYGKKMDDIIVKYGETFIVPECTYVKDGYSFNNWNTNADGSGGAFSVDEKYVYLLNEKASMTLYAQWIKNVADASVITYHLNGGENNSNNPETVKIGKSVKLQNPTKNGYTFKGWFSNSDFKGSKVKSVKGKKNTDYNLYAKWALATYKIKYVNPSGTKAPKNPKNPASYKITDATKDLYAPTRAGYVFTGWYKDKNLTEKIEKIEAGSYGNLTLYSGWRGSEYTVAYEGNGATGGYTENTHHEYKTNGSIAECKYVKDGYSFVKWYKNAKCSGTAYAPGYSKNDFSNKEGDTVTLYAKWKPNKYTVVYDGNGATSGKTKNSTFTYDKKGTLQKCGFKRKGYAFAGWSYDNGIACFSYPDKASDIFNFTTGAETVTLKAEWTPDGSAPIPVSEIHFDIEEISMIGGQTEDLKNHVSVFPGYATNKALTWSSSDSYVASVSNGILTANHAGNATITANAADGSGISATISVLVITGTKVVFPLSTDYQWICKTYAGHGSGTAYSSADFTLAKGGSCEGLPVYAMYDGEVDHAEPGNGQINIRHKSTLTTINGIEYTEWITIYAHMKNITVKVGDKITAGQHIGDVSAVGQASGPHLHINIEAAKDDNGKSLKWWGDPNEDTKYAISPYYVYGFVDAYGGKVSYLTWGTGKEMENRILNHVPR